VKEMLRVVSGFGFWVVWPWMLLAGKICVLAGEICVDYGIVGKSFCFLVTDYYHTKNRSLGRLG
jgi:hypothetical protein